MAANVWQLHHKAGPRYEHWLRETVGALQRTLAEGQPDDVPRAD